MFLLVHHHHHKDKWDRCDLCSPLLNLESCNWSCFLTHGGSVSLSQSTSPVSLCLKSGALGFVLQFLLSHHSDGLAKNMCHRWSRFLRFCMISSTETVNSSNNRYIITKITNRKGKPWCFSESRGFLLPHLCH